MLEETANVFYDHCSLPCKKLENNEKKDKGIESKGILNFSNFL